MNLYDALAAVIGISLATGLVQVFRSRHRADALLAAQLAGTCAVGIVLLLVAGDASAGSPVSIDVAFAAALLAALTAIAFAALGWHGDESGSRSPNYPGFKRDSSGESSGGRSGDGPGGQGD